MNYEYQVGGSLPPNAPSYVCRQADNQLYQSLKNGDFCYVLNSRQMGKSSLRVRTMQRLQKEGIACAAIDVTAIGNEGVTPDRWYAGILYELESDFNLSFNFRTWWREREMLSPVQRLSEFIERVLLTEKKQQIVIFIDEIDSVLSLNFPLDDFFAFIRACYNKRADNFHYQRLTFGLFGVATPADLILDKTRTPFNIGRAIELQGFQLSETQPLAEGLKNKAARPVEVLKAILAWTNGQPFLTQKLCKIILSSSGFIAADTEIKIIEKLVKLQILDNWESLDNPEHLKTIRDRILRRGERASRLLGIYQEVLQKKEIIADNSVEQGELCLSGLVVKTGGKIKVYNAIYRAVFNANWVEKELANMRPYAESMTAWLASNCQDESRLLRGQALEAAQTWAAGKSLSDRDYQFLAASQELDKREVKKALAAEKEANQLLSTAQQKAQKRIRIGGIILAASLVGATLMTIWSGSAVKNANSRLNTAQDATRLEREGMSVLQQFEAGNEQLPVLVSAMKTAQDLQKMVDSKVPVSEYPTTTPLLALQQILDKVTQRNEIKHSGRSPLYKNFTMSPDRKLIAFFGVDGTVRIINMSGKQLTQFKTNTHIQNIMFSPDGKYLATLEWSLKADFPSDKVRLWDISGNLVTEFDAPQISFHHLQFSPDGQRLVTTEYPKGFSLWNLSGQPIIQSQNKINSPSIEIPTIENDIFSSDGKQIVLSDNNILKLWDIATQKFVVELQGVSSSFGTLKFSPNGKNIAIAALRGGTVYISNLSGKLLNKFEVFSENKKPSNAAIDKVQINFSSDGKRLITSGQKDFSSPYETTLWDLSGNQLAKLKADDHYQPRLLFSPDGKSFVTIQDNKVYLWDLSGKQLAKFESKVIDFALTFTLDSKQIVTAESDGKIRFWNLSGQQLTEVTWHQGLVDIDRLFLDFSQDGKKLILFSSEDVDSKISVWDLNSPHFTEKLASQDYSNLGFSPDGKMLATSHDKTVQLWDISGNLLTQLPHQDFVREAEFNLDQKILATLEGQNGNTIYLWSFDGKQIAKIKTDTMCFEDCLRFSSDGQKLIFVKEHYPDSVSVSTFDLSGKLINKIDKDQGIVSPSGQYILEKTSDNQVYLWDLAGQQLAKWKDGFGDHKKGTFLNFQEKINISFSSDEKQIISLQRFGKGSNQVWDLSGKRLATITQGSSFSEKHQIWAYQEKYPGFNNQIIHIANLFGKPIAQFTFSKDDVLIGLSPNKKMIAISNKTENKIYILNSSGHKIGEISQAQAGSFLEFSPDNKFFITYERKNKIVRFWDLSGNLFSEWNNVVSWRDDWRYIAVNENSKLRMLPVSHNLEELLAKGCDWLKYYLETHPDEAKQLKVCQVQ